MEQKIVNSQLPTPNSQSPFEEIAFGSWPVGSWKSSHATVRRMRPRSSRHSGVLLTAGLATALTMRDLPDGTLEAARQARPDYDQIAARVDPYVEKSRVVVMTDIANEPDDQMSMVRFLVYANHFDVEGLIATTSTWMRTASSC